MRVTRISTLFIAAILAANCTTSTLVGWMDTDTRWGIDQCPDVLQSEAFAFPAWKGEKVSAEAVVWSDKDLTGVTATASELRCGDAVIPTTAITAGAVKYVISDTKAKHFGKDADSIHSPEDSIMVADIIDITACADSKAGQPLPFWISVKVPQDAAAGTYTGKLTIKGKGCGKTVLPVTLEVSDRVLPEPEDWKFHLDLWQNPYAVARYHGVEPWSEEHFKYMEPVMKMLAEAGQKVITCTVVDKPWNGQTEDPFQSMVSKTLRKDGSWAYDYSAFDKWVEFMMSVGINEQINCYSILKWGLKMDYFDEASGETVIFATAADSKEFRWYWEPFLKDFSEHLNSKGWLHKTAMAMDERPKKDMDPAIALIKDCAPDLKISLAGWPKDADMDALYDLCLHYGYDYPQDDLKHRKETGKISTFYTCCGPEYPNTFIASTAAEAAWMGWFAAANNLDGYLRWAYNSWVKDPLADGRFRTWMAGDCFFVYPEGRSSIRFEKLTEGIRAYEKIRIIRETASEESLRKLDGALAAFKAETLKESRGADASRYLNEARKILSSL